MSGVAGSGRAREKEGSMSAVTNYAPVRDLPGFGVRPSRRRHLRVVPNSGAAARQHSADAPGRDPRLEGHGATVTRLHAPRPARPAVRLTQRGVLLVSCAV